MKRLFRTPFLLWFVAIACSGATTDIPDAGQDATVDEGGQSDAMDDANPMCGKGEVLCGSTCYPNNIDHCGPSCAQCGAPSNGAATCDGTSCGFTCSLLQCGSTCVDPSTDPHNCGACGHDCLSKSDACTSGICQPQQLFTDTAAFLRVDDTNLYWIGFYTNEIYYGPKSGGTSAVFSIAQSGTLALDATNVYYPYTSGKAILYHAKTGGVDSEIDTVGAVQPSAGELYIDGEYLYFETPNNVTAVAYDGGAGPSFSVLQPRAIASHGAYLYVGSFIAPQLGSAIVRANIQDLGGTSQFAYFDGGTIDEMVTDNNNLYATIGLGIATQPLDGGLGAFIPAGSGNTLDIAIDSTNIYWAETMAGIYKAPIGGGSKTKLAMVASPASLAVDDMYVYYATVTGAIYRVPK